MRPCRLTGSTNGGNPGRRLMRRPRFGLVSRPREALASRPPAKRPAALNGCTCAATKERWPPLRIAVPDRDLVAARKYGSEGHKTPQVERREAPSSDRKEEGDASQASHRAALAGPLKGVSQTPASAGAPLPLREPRFGLRDEGLPGADIKNTGGGALPAERDRTSPAAHDEGRPLNAPRPSCRRRGRRPARARSAPPPDAARPP